jgi:hypothetical protein
MQALRIFFLVFAIAIAALIGWRVRNPEVQLRQAIGIESQSAAVIPRLSQSPPPRLSIEDQLAEAPDYARFFADFKHAFPADYSRIINSLSVRTAANGQFRSPDLYLSETLRDLRQTRGILAAQADPEPLGRVFDVQAQILAKLAATFPTLCLDFLYGGASQSFLDFSAQNRDLIAAMAEAALQAILDGEAKKIQRPAPSVDEFNLLEQDLVARGLDTVEIGALLDGRMPDPPLPAASMCTAGRTYLDALQNLPEETKLKMFALAVELMARS